MADPTLDVAARALRRIHRAPGEETQQRFVALSVVITGYDDAELWGTGMVGTYLGYLLSAVGDQVTGELLSRWADVSSAAGSDPDALERLVREQIFGDANLGPVARNLIVMWYLGQWQQMPADWRDLHGAHVADQSCVISPEAYAQGLVWDAMGSHPMGAKMPGYGSWALPPKSRKEPA